MKIHVRKPPRGRHRLAVNQSRKPNSDMPAICRPLQSPNDSEQKAPTMTHISDTNVAAVEADRGRVRALNTGTALITVTSEADGTKAAVCPVTVLEAGPACEGGVDFKDL